MARHPADAHSRGGGRLRWVCVLPFTDIPACIEQLNWSRERGAVGFMARGIEGSPEFRTIEVQQLFQHYLKRAADPQGLSFFTNQLAAGATTLAPVGVAPGLAAAATAGAVALRLSDRGTDWRLDRDERTSAAQRKAARRARREPSGDDEGEQM